MIWSVKDKRGIVNTIRTTDNYFFSDNLKKRLCEELKRKSLTGDIDVRNDELDHSLVIALRKYQFLIEFLKWKIDNKAYSISDIYKDPVWDYSKELITNGDNIRSYIARFSTTKGMNGLLGTIRSMIIQKDVSSISRLTDNINGWIEKAMLDLKTDYVYPNTLLNDYNRIATSSSFRRLQAKAQVFPLETHDYARTRLTHSFEVSGIARELANNIAYSRRWPRIQNYKIAFKFEKILECAGLLHDVGNPPFGHYGEDAIKNYFRDKWDKLEIVNYKEKFDRNDIKTILLKEIMEGHSWSEQAKNDFLCFDGNAQALRVISKLQRYKNARSLELSACILGAIIKYPFNSVEGAEKMKLGYFLSEEDLIEKLKCLDVFRPKYRNPLSMLLEAADDISYITSDFDDAVSKNVITKEIFDLEIKRYQEFVAKGILTKSDNVDKFISDFHYYYKRSVDEDNKEPFKYTVLRMVNDLKKKLILSVSKAFVNHYDEIVEGIYFDGHNGEDNRIELLDYEEITNKDLIKWIRDNLFVKYLYKDNAILGEELKGEGIIKTLLDEYTHAVLSLDFEKNKEGKRALGHNKEFKKCFFREEKVFGTISSNFVDTFYKEYDNADSDGMKTYYKLRLVVDYVSGMTDSYALECYQNLKGIE